jgi:hypothetical protein
MKKIAFVNFHNLWSVHHETELEIMASYENIDSEIYKFQCSKIVGRCDLNRSGEKVLCEKCELKNYFGLTMINKNIKIIDIVPEAVDFVLPQFSTISELKQIKVDGFDVGYAVLSSILSETRDPYYDIVDNMQVVTERLRNAINMYYYFCKEFQLILPDLVYIFNGRFSYERAALRACEKYNIPYITHDRGSSKNKYMVFENSLPHDRNKFIYRMNFAWENDDVPYQKKIDVAHSFYTKKRQSIEFGWISFTKNQDPSLLPNYWRGDKHNIVIFLSSEDEFLAIGDQWEFKLFKNQIEGLEFVLSNYSRDKFKDYFFTIRIHPNSASLFDFIKCINEFASDNIEIILPESKVSSYKLLESADKVVSFGSTMGIEAAYSNKVSINLGVSFYDGLSVTYNPQTKQETIDLIYNDHLIPLKNDLNILKYGYYSATFGLDYKFYEPKNLWSGLFRGKDLNKLILEFGNSQIWHLMNYFLTVKMNIDLNSISRRLLTKYIRLTKL